MNKFESAINQLKINLEEMINKFKTIIETMNFIYNINNNIISNYEKNKNRNYKLTLNTNHTNEHTENEISNTKEKYDYGHNTNKTSDTTEIKHKSNKGGKVRTSGSDLAKNNKDKRKTPQQLD